jgi:uncharacterized membrane protein YccC
MTIPGLRDWLFSLKTFAGAMLALWIAMRLNLDRPYWAMATAYIVAQPLTGAMRSKAIYRFFGTLLGAVATLVLVPNLVDAPELLIAALALWVAGCIYFAILDRTPRAYLFLLAGYTVALIGFPSVDAPGAIWDTVVARVEEITLGIVCTTMVGTLVFPTALGPVLTARLDAWIRNAAAAAVAVLFDDRGETRLVAARRRIGADAVEIGLLASHLAYDTSNLQSATRPLALIQQRVVLMLPVISGLDDRLTSLRANDGVTPGLAVLLDHVGAWIGDTATAPAEHAAVLRDAADAIEPRLDAAADWNAIMLSGVLTRLRELINLVHDIRVLRRQIAAGSPRLPDLALHPDQVAGRLRHADHVMALHSAVAAVVAIGVICAYWIGAAWPDGAGAAALGAVACAFFAAQDDPAPSIMAFLRGTVVALVLDAVYLFAILPQARDFETLALAMAPAFLILGVLAGMPATARAAGPITFIAATELALSSSYSADFAAYANASIAAIVGLGMTATIIRVVRSVGANWTATRLLRANRAAIATAARGGHPADRLAFLTLTLDRLSEIVPRLAAAAEGADTGAVKAMADLRVGVNVVDLRHDAACLTEGVRDAVETVMRGIAAHYERRVPREPPLALLDAIDAAIAETTRWGAADIRDPLLRLVGIRRALFPNGRPYAPASRPELEPEVAVASRVAA